MHSLEYLMDKIELDPPENLKKFLISLSELSVPTRYPEETDVTDKEYNQELAEKTFSNAKELLAWLKSKHSTTQ